MEQQSSEAPLQQQPVIVTVQSSGQQQQPHQFVITIQLPTAPYASQPYSVVATTQPQNVVALNATQQENIAATSNGIIPQNDPKFPPRRGYIETAGRVTGVVQLLAGYASILLGVVGVIFMCPMANFGVPIWSGHLFAITGIIGICTKAEKTKLIETYLVLSTISAIFAVGQVIFAGIQATRSIVSRVDILNDRSSFYNDFAYVEELHSNTSGITVGVGTGVVGLAELCAAIIASALCCHAIYRRASSRSPVDVQNGDQLQKVEAASNVPVPQNDSALPSKGGYRETTGQVTGVIQVFIGIASILFGVVAILFTGPMASVGSPIWNGILFMTCGFIGSCTKSDKKCVTIAYMVMCIISAILAGGQLLFATTILIMSSSDQQSAYNPFHEFSSFINRETIGLGITIVILIIAFVELCVAIIGSALCCHGVCRRSTDSVPGVVQYSNAQHATAPAQLTTIIPFTQPGVPVTVQYPGQIHFEKDKTYPEQDEHPKQPEDKHPNQTEDEHPKQTEDKHPNQTKDEHPKQTEDMARDKLQNPDEVSGEVLAQPQHDAPPDYAKCTEDQASYQDIVTIEHDLE